MKIDEAIEHSRQVAIKKEDCLECAKEHEQLADWLEELKWYRGQDLIRRKDVTRMTLPYWTTVSLVRDKVMQIPKAEYRGEVDEI